MFQKSNSIKKSILDLPDDIIRCVLSEYLDNATFVDILRSSNEVARNSDLAETQRCVNSNMKTYGFIK
jgi:hypothetical protein